MDAIVRIADKSIDECLGVATWELVDGVLKIVFKTGELTCYAPGRWLEFTLYLVEE